MSTVRILAYINVILLILLASSFILRRIKKYTSIETGPGYNKALKIMGKLHPYLGISLILSGIVHGYMAIRTVRLNTGYILWGLIVVMGLIRVYGAVTKNKNWVKVHRVIDILVFIALLFHVFARNII
ncbi:hypothetical protein [Alkalibacter saccharofermentans]|uniref:Uncharacterized protein n=1 Tax=Alkalibacter saccharofermentans DSM 14828 TaxID=1120975 RepID=A0A1M4SB52_9FIRM|nr:hypothetical protein [Alkalibacter saccharofermentans]SHE29365.1 hypothetical protein SAMN02746064_00189 [Alkalibacter saccharofermentans DSM 14828]